MVLASSKDTLCLLLFECAFFCVPFKAQGHFTDPVTATADFSLTRCVKEV